VSRNAKAPSVAGAEGRKALPYSGRERPPSIPELQRTQAAASPTGQASSLTPHGARGGTSSPPPKKPAAGAPGFGWRVIGPTDPSGKRIICMCSRCSTTRTFGAEALAQRDVGLCDCSRAKVSAKNAQHAHAWGWAAAAARLEGAEATFRKKVRR